MSDGARPIIIKRRKVAAAGGHHGGAWKVAYADFVTAMMAFFMLMWLLNATTEAQRKGLADYFAPTIAVSRTSAGGDGFFGGESMMPEETLIRAGQGASERNPTDDRAASGATGFEVDGDEPQTGADAAMEAIEESLRARAGESLDDGVMRHVVTRVTDEGLVVEVFALPGRPIFDDEGRPTQTLAAIAGVLAEGFAFVRNGVAVEGHVAAQPRPLRADPAWSVSHERADSVRRLLEGADLPAARVARVTGHADREPAISDPMAARNDRVEIILLRKLPPR